MSFRTENLVLSTEHLKAIGHVAIRAAQLDLTIEHLIAFLLQKNQRQAEIILKQVSTAKQIEFLEAILLEEFPNHHAEVQTFVSELQSSRSDRNDIIHWIWSGLPDTDLAAHAAIRPFREPRYATKSANEVYIIADRLLACSAHSIAIMNALVPSRAEEQTRKRFQLSPPPKFPFFERPELQASQKAQTPPPEADQTKDS